MRMDAHVNQIPNPNLQGPFPLVTNSRYVSYTNLYSPLS